MYLAIMKKSNESKSSVKKLHTFSFLFHENNLYHVFTNPIVTLLRFRFLLLFCKWLGGVKTTQ